MVDILEGDTPEPIVLKKKVPMEAGAHGGAWKVAYADFVTAMMAFFLLLWLLNATTEEQMTGLSDYFAPTSIAEQAQGIGEALRGLDASIEETLRNATSRPRVSVALPAYGDEEQGDREGEIRDDFNLVDVNIAESTTIPEEDPALDDAMATLKQSILENEDLRDLQDSIVFDETKDGIRVQLLDRQGREMFEPGTSEMTPRARRMLALISSILVTLPHQISLTGHTSSEPPPNASPEFGNWELSGMRASASREWMVENGVVGTRILHVEGRADSELLDRRDPTNAINRRISITILRDEPKKRAQLPNANSSATSGNVGTAPPPLPPAGSDEEG